MKPLGWKQVNLLGSFVPVKDSMKAHFKCGPRISNMDSFHSLSPSLSCFIAQLAEHGTGNAQILLQPPEFFRLCARITSLLSFIWPALEICIHFIQSNIVVWGGGGGGR